MRKLMLEVTFTIRLTLQGPILTQATAIGAIGIDAPMARDSAGQYYLPFSLVRGRLRQSWAELNEATADALPAQGEIDDLLGPSPGKIIGREPQRGRPKDGPEYFARASQDVERCRGLFQQT